MIGTRIGSTLSFLGSVVGSSGDDEGGAVDPVAVWIFGQSNSTTMCPVADLTDQTYNASYSRVAMVAMQSANAVPTWETSPEQALGPISNFQPGTGAKVGFSSSLGRDLDRANPNGFAVIHTGAWGSGATFWDTNFETALDYVEARMVELGCTSLVFVTKIGEEDSKTLAAANNHDTWMAGKIDEVRTRFPSMGHGGGEVPVFVGQLSATSTYGAFTTETRASITALPGLRTNTTVVDLDSVPLDPSEPTPTHFNADGMIAVGHLYAGAVATALGLHIPPIADWSASVSGLDVTFTDESLSPSDAITTYLWDFGDGSTSALANPSHTYATDGTYSVSLTITNSYGAIAAHSDDVAVTGLAVSSDAASGAYLPETDAEWTAMLGDIANGMSNPDEFWLPGETAAGNLIGVNGLITLNAKNTPSYMQSVAGWATGAVSWADGTTKGFDSTDADLPDMGTEDALVLMYVALTAPISTRNVLQLGTPSASRMSVDALSTSNIRSFQAGTSTNGSGAVGTYTGVRAILLKVDRTNSVVRVYTDLEKISPGSFIGTIAGKAMAIGAGPAGGSPLSSAPAHYLYMAMWKGVKARITDAQAKSLIIGLGNGIWAPPWT